MDDFIIGFSIGWGLGSAGMWVYFRLAGLLRTREEWQASRRTEK
jgi:hypothetical protein